MLLNCVQISYRNQANYMKINYICICIFKSVKNKLNYLVGKKWQKNVEKLFPSYPSHKHQYLSFYLRKLKSNLKCSKRYFLTKINKKKVNYCSPNTNPDHKFIANINFINSYRLKQTFEQVESEVWMMVLDETIADINPLESDKQKGFYGRKTTSYKNFVINKPKPDEFFNGPNIVVQDSQL